MALWESILVGGCCLALLNFGRKSISMGKNAKVTRFGSHVAAKRAKKGQQQVNEGRKEMRKVLKEAKKKAKEENAVVSKQAKN